MQNRIDSPLRAHAGISAADKRFAHPRLLSPAPLSLDSKPTTARPVRSARSPLMWLSSWQ